MKIDYAAYKITLLLYLGILIFPLGFYFSYNSLQEIQRDTQAISSFTLASSFEIDEQTLETLRPWMLQNGDTEFYVASEPLVKKYDRLLECFVSHKSSNKEKQVCFKEAKSIIFSLNNMLKLKQNRVYNILYINLFIGIALLIFLIFFVRAYIQNQLQKNAIYDFKSKLHNKEYMQSILKELAAQAKREKTSFSLLSMHIENVNDSDVEYIGKIFLKTLRESDIACRYETDKFMLILPSTKSHNVESIIIRIEEHFKGLKYNLEVIPYNHDTSYEELIKKIN